MQLIHNDFTWSQVICASEQPSTKKDKTAVENDVKNWAYISLIGN